MIGVGRSGLLLCALVVLGGSSAFSRELCLEADQGLAVSKNVSVAIHTRPCHRDGSEDLDRWRVGSSLVYRYDPGYTPTLGYRHEQIHWPRKSREQRIWQWNSLSPAAVVLVFCICACSGPVRECR